MMEDLKFAIPQRHLTTATEALKELALRLEIEAASLAVVNSREGLLKADKRLEQAVEVYKTFEYFLNL